MPEVLTGLCSSVKVSCLKKHEKMTSIQYSFVAATRHLNFIVQHLRPLLPSRTLLHVNKQEAINLLNLLKFSETDDSYQRLPPQRKGFHDQTCSTKFSEPSHFDLACGHSRKHAPQSDWLTSRKNIQVPFDWLMN